MGKFSQSFCMTIDDVAEYARTRLDVFAPDAELQVEEIGDGNINYIFRVQDVTGRSVILKHSYDFMRNSDTRRLSTDRAAVECEILRIHGKLAPGRIPEVHHFDPVMHITAMEDLRDIEMMRIPLARWQTFPLFAEQLSEYAFNTLVRTSDLALDPAKKRRMAAQFVNTEMCEITDRLVFTEPYKNRQGLNSYRPELKRFVSEELYNDEDLHARVGILKERFRNASQSLIHGDLHTGSIFVSKGNMKVIDPEFGCYGPMGYDIGNVLANLTFPLVSADLTDGAPEVFGAWAVETIADIVDQFICRYTSGYNDLVTDPMYGTESFCRAYLDGVLADTAGFAGTEIIRRTVGVAKVPEVTGTEDPERRLALEQTLVGLGKTLVMHANDFTGGSAYRTLLDGRPTK